MRTAPVPAAARRCSTPPSARWSSTPAGRCSCWPGRARARPRRWSRRWSRGSSAGVPVEQLLHAHLQPPRGRRSCATGWPRGCERTVREPVARTLHSYAFGVLRMANAARGLPAPRLLSAPEQDVVLPRAARRAATRRAGRRRCARRCARTGVRRRAARPADARGRARPRRPGAGARSGRARGRADWVAAGEFLDRVPRRVRDEGPRRLRHRRADPRRAQRPARRPGAAGGRAGAPAAHLRRRVPGHRPGAGRAAAAARADGADELVLVGDPDQSIYAFRGRRRVGDPRGRRAVRRPATPVPMVALRRSRRSGADAARRHPPAGRPAARPGRAARDQRRRRGCRPGGPTSRCSARRARRPPTSPGVLRAAHLDGLPWSQMAVLVRSTAPTLGALRRAMITAGVPVTVRGDDLPLAEQPAVALLLDRCSAASSNPPALDEDLAESLLVGPLGGGDSLYLRRLRRELRRTLPGRGRRAGPGPRATVLGAQPLPATLRRPGRCGWPACWPPARDARGRRGEHRGRALGAVARRRAGRADGSGRACAGGVAGTRGRPRPRRRARAVRRRRPRFTDRLPGAGAGAVRSSTCARSRSRATRSLGAAARARSRRRPHRARQQGPGVGLVCVAGVQEGTLARPAPPRLAAGHRGAGRRRPRHRRRAAGARSRRSWPRSAGCSTSPPPARGAGWSSPRSPATRNSPRGCSTSSTRSTSRRRAGAAGARRAPARAGRRAARGRVRRRRRPVTRRRARRRAAAELARLAAAGVPGADPDELVGAGAAVHRRAARPIPTGRCGSARRASSRSSPASCAPLMQDLGVQRRRGGRRLARHAGARPRRRTRPDDQPLAEFERQLDEVWDSIDFGAVVVRRQRAGPRDRRCSSGWSTWLRDSRAELTRVGVEERVRGRDRRRRGRRAGRPARTRRATGRLVVVDLKTGKSKPRDGRPRRTTRSSASTSWPSSTARSPTRRRRDGRRRRCWCSSGAERRRSSSGSRRSPRPTTRSGPRRAVDHVAQRMRGHEFTAQRELPLPDLRRPHVLPAAGAGPAGAVVTARCAPGRSARRAGRACSSCPSPPTSRPPSSSRGSEPAAVVAGAGSGKTETMAARVVWLVANRRVAPDADPRPDVHPQGRGRARRAGAPPARRSGGASSSATRPTTSSTWRCCSRPSRPCSPTPPTPGGWWASRRCGSAPSPTRGCCRPALLWQIADTVVRRWPGDLPEFTAISSLVHWVIAMSGQFADHLAEPDAVEQFCAAALDHFFALPIGQGARSETPNGTGPYVDALRQRRALVPLVREYQRAKQAHGRGRLRRPDAPGRRTGRRCDEVAAVERERYRAVLLDEYQDTGHAQIVMLRGLFGGGHPVTAVGDPFQSIYGWRGASARQHGRVRRHVPARRRHAGHRVPAGHQLPQRPRDPRRGQRGGRAAARHDAHRAAAPARRQRTGRRWPPRSLETVDDEAAWVAAAGATRRGTPCPTGARTACGAGAPPLAAAGAGRRAARRRPAGGDRRPGWPARPRPRSSTSSPRCACSATTSPAAR